MVGKVLNGNESRLGKMLNSQQQEGFAQTLAYGVDGKPASQSDAYRLNYDTSNMKPESIWVNASQLASDAKVARRVEELRQAVQERVLVAAGWTQARLVMTAEEHRVGAVGDHQWSAANGALKLIAEVTGLLEPQPQATVQITKVTVILSATEGDKTIEADSWSTNE